MEGRPLGEGEQEDQQAWEALFGGDEDAVQEAPRRSPSGDAYFAGGGLASLAGAAYLVRDCGFTGERIHIYERLPVLGGSNDGSGDGTHGFVIRGGRMLNEETYENFWELFSSIPSLENPDRSVTEEILNFDRAHPTYARARLVGRDGKILAVTGMGFNREDRFALARLLMAPEQSLTASRFRIGSGDAALFQHKFWRLWQTTCFSEMEQPV
ncbi:MAG: oleate hydratase [Hydrogeniiclostridium mannosilyticum]